MGKIYFSFVSHSFDDRILYLRYSTFYKASGENTISSRLIKNSTDEIAKE